MYLPPIVKPVLATKKANRMFLLPFLDYCTYSTIFFLCCSCPSCECVFERRFGLHTFTKKIESLELELQEAKDRLQGDWFARSEHLFSDFASDSDFVADEPPSSSSHTPTRIRSLLFSSSSSSLFIKKKMKLFRNVQFFCSKKNGTDLIFLAVGCSFDSPSWAS